MEGTRERLDGAAGIVTGGGRGIGAATARELTRLGARVVIADLSVEACADVLDEIAANGGEAFAVAADVRDATSLARVRDACLERYGRVDFAVANAGVGDTGSIADGDPERWRFVLEVNVLGVALTARSVLPTMLEQGDGHIILIASVSGRESYIGEPIYIASKWAVVGLGHALRKETAGKGVRVTLIEPGVVDTVLARANIFAQTLFETVTPLSDTDIARVVGFALRQPKRMALNEIVLRSAGQEL
ncbi:MAG: SDR family oxidoreductase [Thermomicrobiales bacterium]|nr:SDR family oxidoreductase [Thermomicrobiales bacterium]